MFCVYNVYNRCPHTANSISAYAGMDCVTPPFLLHCHSHAHILHCVCGASSWLMHGSHFASERSPLNIRAFIKPNNKLNARTDSCVGTSQSFPKSKNGRKSKHKKNRHNRIIGQGGVMFWREEPINAKLMQKKLLSLKYLFQI